MAVNNMPKPTNQFWPCFFGNRISALVLVQILISAGVGAALVLTNTVQIDSLMLWIIIPGLLLINLTFSILFFVNSTKPTKELLAAIMKVAGDLTDLTPPNPNDKKYERSGLGDALQTIYKLSSSRDNIPAGQALAVTDRSSSKTLSIAEALDTTTCGFIALDANHSIIYSNKSAPTFTNNEGKKELKLIFNGNDTLDDWLKTCEEKSVHDEHAWSRIPDRLPNEEGRRFFDVIASYQKGAAAETVLSLVDRTGAYIIDEENLDFVSFAAHELRGPITVIRGYLDVLQDELDGVLQEDQKQLFHRLIISSNRLSGYINNILNTSRYDRRHLKVHLVEDTVANVYDVISDDMQLRAGVQNRMLSVAIPKDLPTIAVDRASMSEVFGNLIDNAIKYSNEGGIINVSAKVYGDFVEVAIQDHGIGMPDNVVSQLFQKFYRSHRSRETVAGTGIGLYISKAIVESHGGTISVRSEDGKGSTFTVLLPIYATVADKLKAGNNSNESIIKVGSGWIKNHSMFRG